MKSRAGMKALIDNHQTRDLGMLLTQEPSITASGTRERQRVKTIPTDGGERLDPISKSDLRQSKTIHVLSPATCSHPDLASIKIWMADTRILVFSAYISLYRCTGPRRHQRNRYYQLFTTQYKRLSKISTGQPAQYRQEISAATTRPQRRYSELSLHMRRNYTAKLRKAYDGVNWEKIGIEVKNTVESLASTAS
ncbi:uncharacterized protein N7498_008974 [Penicillium cinerascens]|uniref:Uncharacterized protein n=1 Tax=Penicillium cinerascens TaxID=70096 RepID=A0A9W9MA63_9EURO|nr:uncharacterized protein N7498_008974 [Penicillium cinerascens]KAJ5195536.1 hypothetical protein N7498_008974 [Penicillium cinerascens]